LRNYECIIILSPEAGEAVSADGSKKYANVIVSGGGEITKLDDWGKRRLAYQIRHNAEGFYLFIQFRSEHKVIEELDRQLRLDEKVLRHLIVRDLTATGKEPKVDIEGIQQGEEVKTEEG
jgi:small subunit ribosomal protein S6